MLVSTVLIASSVGAGVEPADVTKIGLPVILGLSLVTGASEFLSSRSHRNLMSAQFRQHSWDYKHSPDKQIKSLVRKFMERGLPVNDAESVVQRLAATERFFVNLLVQEDIGIQLPEESDGAVLLEICCMMISYAALGCAPIAVYATSAQTGLPDRNLLLASITVSAVLLCLLGALKAAFAAAGSSAVCAAVEACAVGLACSLVGFLVAHQLFRE